MRILVLSNTPFLPAHAGNAQRVNQMLAYLGARGARLGALMLPAVDLPAWDVDGMRARVDYFEVARGRPWPLSRLRARAARARRRLGGVPPPAGLVGVDDWCPRWFQERAAAVVRAWQADVVIAEYVFLSACLERVRAGCLTVIDTHDVMHRRTDALAAAGLAPWWFCTTYAEEQRGLARAELILAIQDDEADVFRAMAPAATVLTVPHGCPVEPAPPAAARPARLLLVASYNEINVQGLRWFLAEVWPALRRVRADAELVVCGNIDEKVRDVPAGVVLRGPVEALGAEYAAARVVVTPVGGGTGLKVKVVEALCHGRPVVTTPAGAAGLDTGEAAGVLVADEPGDFAATLARLLDDPTRWTRLTAAATAHATRRFSPEAAFAPLVAHLEEAVRARHRDPSTSR
jgi:glycosyltransferase involved in cell wall biosynthesis